MIRLFCRILLIGATVLPGAARGAPMSTGGYEFSDELGGFELLSVRGTGTRDDPFVVVEEIFGRGPAVLIIRDLAWLEGGRPLGSEMGIRVQKVVLNASQFPWTSYRLELREHQDQTSDYYDGLSFDQPNRMFRPFRSDVFRHADEDLEPHDSVTFSAGTVGPGESASLDFAITDPTPKSVFFLRQTVNHPVSRYPSRPGPTRESRLMPDQRDRTATSSTWGDHGNWSMGATDSSR